MPCWRGFVEAQHGQEVSGQRVSTVSGCDERAGDHLARGQDVAAATHQHRNLVRGRDRGPLVEMCVVLGGERAEPDGDDVSHTVEVGGRGTSQQGKHQ